MHANVTKLTHLPRMVLAVLLGFAAGAGPGLADEARDTGARLVDPPVPIRDESVEFTASVWADNWFAFYVNGQLVGEDSIPITETRSFNSDTFTFRATYPLTIAVVTRDYIENDSGLEYIGSFFGLFPVSDSFTLFQQIGDGGFIAQVTESESGQVVATTSKGWRGMVIHEAPLNPDCEKSTQPLIDCKSRIADAPVGWRRPGFDDSKWVAATEYTEEQIGARFGYNDIDWDPSAKLVWTDNIKIDNTILWRHQVPAP